MRIYFLIFSKVQNFRLINTDPEEDHILDQELLERLHLLATQDVFEDLLERVGILSFLPCYYVLLYTVSLFYLLLYHNTCTCILLFFLFSVPLEVFRLPPSSNKEFGEEQPSVKYIQSAHTHGPAPGNTSAHRDTNFSQNLS